MIARVVIACLLCAASSSLAADNPQVRIEPSHLQGPRPLEKQTEAAVIRDYLQAWASLRNAFAQNRGDLLDSSFVGDARGKLGETISERNRLGVTTRYQDRTHDIQIVFYSPDGLSIQLIDNVAYDMQMFEKEKIKTSETASERYVVVLTPSEVRWRVRILQGQAN